MKRLFVKDAAPAAEIGEPREGFLNLYLTGSVSSHSHDNVEVARAARTPNARRHGLTLRISRDSRGDFTIEKVEEF
jgi:hypothetical protein